MLSSRDLGHVLAQYPQAMVKGVCLASLGVLSHRAPQPAPVP